MTENEFLPIKQYGSITKCDLNKRATTARQKTEGDREREREGERERNKIK